MFLFSVIIKGHDHATCSSIIHVFMMSLMLSLLTSRTTWVTKSCLIFVFPSHVAEIHGDVAFLSHQHPSKTPRDRSAARAKHGTGRGHWLKGSSTIACGDWWHIVFYLLQIQGEFDWICKKTKNNKRTVPGNGILHVTFDSADSYSLQPIPIPRAPTCGPSEKRRKASLSPGTRGICPGTDAWSFRWH